MPKRLSHRWEMVVTEDNCIAAVKEMLKGKKRKALHANIFTPDKRKIKRIMLKRVSKRRRRTAVDYFRQHAEEVGKELSRQLREGVWTPRPYREKLIYDILRGKWRKLKVPCLFDQCAHHAIMRVAEPDILARKYYYDCGSMPGAGQSRAVDALKRHMAGNKARKYCLSMDIRHWFDECTKQAVMWALRRLYKDRKYLSLHEIVLDSMGGVLAIGFYPSPWYGSLLLRMIVDNYIKQEELSDAFYVRYADDMRVLHDNKRKLRRLREAISRRLASFGLRLKGDWQVFPTKKRGIAFLSYVFHRGFTLLRKQLMYRFSRLAKSAARGVTPRIAMALMSYKGILKRCNSYNLKKERMDPYVSYKKCRSVIKYVSTQCGVRQLPSDA